jgi:hypothetical protein
MPKKGVDKKAVENPELKNNGVSKNGGVSLDDIKAAAPKFNTPEVDDLAAEVATLATKVNYEKARAELSSKDMDLKLPLDPVSKGLGQLHGLLANVQDKMDRCKQHLLVAIWTRNEWERLLSRIEAVYERRASKVLMETLLIQSLRNSTLQQAGVAAVLFKEKKLLDEVTRNVEQVKAFLELSRVCYSNLESTDRNISRQIKVVVLQASIGEVKTKTGFRLDVGNED